MLFSKRVCLFTCFIFAVSYKRLLERASEAREEYLMFQHDPLLCEAQDKLYDGPPIAPLHRTAASHALHFWHLMFLAFVRLVWVAALGGGGCTVRKKQHR